MTFSPNPAAAATDPIHDPPIHDPMQELLTNLGETVLATGDAIDMLTMRVDNLSEQLHQNECQIFALGEEIKSISHNQGICLSRVEQLTRSLQQLGDNLIANLAAPT
jgi:chromosome segregation ATPase